MKFSIIIPTAFDHLESDLKPCIESIIKYTDLTSTEVIVVSNGSTDGTDIYVTKLGPPFKLITRPTALGYAAACNLGLEAAEGDYAVLLNNDTKLLEQYTNCWLNTLEGPFLEDSSVGVTGPLMLYSKETKQDFLVFFIVAIKKELYKKLRLNEEYDVGAGEDTEYCIEAKKLGYKIVACDKIRGSDDENKVMLGTFPIYHVGESTVGKLPNWQELFDGNSLKLSKKYNPDYYAFKLSNNFERAVIGKEDKLEINTREHARYTFAASHLVGKKVLEIGCSSGYGLSFLPENIEYTGIDYDAKIIEFAKENFEKINRTFICIDAHKFEFNEYYDTIIAFEFIEHIDDGREFAQELKKHCNNLLITTPFKEIPGFWGSHHKLHGLSEKDFPGFSYYYLNGYGKFIDKPDSFDGQNLLVMQWQKGVIYERPVEKPTILAFVPTKDRYDSLALTLQAIALQTLVPDKVVIFDDGEHRDIREDTIYKHIFTLFQLKGIQWEVLFGNKQGQHYGHQYANNTDFNYVWRIDDDEVPEPTVLTSLVAHMTSGVGAVAGAVVTPGQNQPGGTNKMEDIFDTPNLQWAIGNQVKEVEHLYSSFLYRPGIAKYNLELSQIGR